VNVFDAGDELISQQEDRLEGEFAAAKVEEVFKRGTEEVQDHGVVITFCTEPADKGDTDTACEGFVDAGFVLKLGVLGFDGFELDGDFFTRDDVCACVRRRRRVSTEPGGGSWHRWDELIRTKVNITETAAADFAANTVLIAHTEILWYVSHVVVSFVMPVVVGRDGEVDKATDEGYITIVVMIA